MSGVHPLRAMWSLLQSFQPDLVFLSSASGRASASPPMPGLSHYAGSLPRQRSLQGLGMQVQVVKDLGKTRPGPPGCSRRLPCSSAALG